MIKFYIILTLYYILEKYIEKLEKLNTNDEQLYLFLNVLFKLINI